MELGDNDCALVLRENGEFEICVPTYDDDEFVSENAVTISLIGILLTQQDDDFASLMSDKFTEYMGPRSDA